jgi:predicted P-loop ATPase
MCAELAMGFGGKVNMEAKAADIVQGMQGLWIIEMDEMVAYSRAAVADMKRFITEQKDRVRMAYARNTEDYPRQCAFIGTINPDECGYLKDNQNRRYWPVTVGQMDIERMKAEVEQLWAEVVVLFKQGEACYIEDRDLELEVQEEIDKRKIQDSWVESVIRFLNMPRGDDVTDPVTEWGVSDIYTGAIGGSIQQFTNFHRDRIVSIMLSLGWKKLEVMQGKTQIIKFVK